ncbi:MAG: nitroreductase family protein [Candidatus Hodarchaeales archaeon]
MTDIGKEFMEKTRYKYAKASDQQRGLQQPPLEKDSNPGSAIIELPSPRDLTFDYSLKKAINERESVRKYTDQPLTLEELSWLLWCAQGVKEVTNRRATLRTVPSAGARHAFETYVLVNRVKDLQPGLYRFMAINPLPLHGYQSQIRRDKHGYRIGREINRCLFEPVNGKK